MELENEVDQPESRRDMLAASFDNLETPEVETKPVIDRNRDEQGKFAPETPKAEAPKEPLTPDEQQMTQRELTTWRKEYRPLQDKLGRGEALSAEEARKLYEYNFEREKQYAAGVTAYKGEAEQARELTSVMNEFMPILQQNNIQPATWIKKLGNAHRTLVMGTPEQKVQMFSQLAQEYGVPLAAIHQAQQGQVDPVAMQLMQELQMIKQQVSGVTNWREQQEQAAVHQELAKFWDTSKYPHFEQVRGDMALLLEAGRAQDLDDAYAKAVRLSDDAWKAEQDRIAQANMQSQQQAKAVSVAKAKASGGQVKSATPSTMIPVPTAKDRRGALMEAFDSVEPGRV